MPRTRTKPRKTRPLPMQYYIFEITGWQPSYLFSVNSDTYREGCWREYAEIDAQGVCIYPEPLVGRPAKITFSGDRECLQPTILRHQPDWKPRCVGSLEMSATDGQFYTSVPYDALSFLVQALASGAFKFVLLWGPALYRRKSLCMSMELAQSVDLNDY